MAILPDMQDALCFSGPQVDDVIMIRRLFHHKIGQLARHRRALLHQMSHSQVDLCHASEKLSGLNGWAECLKQNGSEEYRTLVEFALALLRGVSQVLANLPGLVHCLPVCWL